MEKLLPKLQNPKKIIFFLGYLLYPDIEWILKQIWCGTFHVHLNQLGKITCPTIFHQAYLSPLFLV